MRNGRLQGMVNYPDVQTAVVEKGALEGHCICDSGFCKLHITYSRHSDLSIKVKRDRSRDYTMPNPAVAIPATTQPESICRRKFTANTTEKKVQQRQPQQRYWMGIRSQSLHGSTVDESKVLLVICLHIIMVVQTSNALERVSLEDKVV
ncbi:hypothetical protein Bca52824_022020 [Brassica carinata]|uniref:Uncharacterized protein n=1 Tax=Brassica carinata TaxID=52824 RepID=A0A8X8ASS3_BRACI|nr:hypothetical protein Bca52824_022020 [Brassica carinata]